MSVTTTVRMSKSQFLSVAGTMMLNIGETTIDAPGRIYKEGTGNVGWYFNAKVNVTPGQPITLYVNGTPITLDFDQFSTGNWGWGLNGLDRVQTTTFLEDGSEVKISIVGNISCHHSNTWKTIPTTPVQAQLGFRVTVDGSKKWAS